MKTNYIYVCYSIVEDTINKHHEMHAVRFFSNQKAARKYAEECNNLAPRKFGDYIEKSVTIKKQILWKDWI